MLVLGIIGIVIFFDKITFFEVTSLLLLASGSLITGVCTILIISANLTVEKDIYDYHMERECIIKQVEYINSDYENVSKATVIQNVYDWNRKVYNANYWSNNQWTSWFWNKDFVNSLEYIEMEDYND